MPLPAHACDSVQAHEHVNVGGGGGGDGCRRSRHPGQSQSPSTHGASFGIGRHCAYALVGRLMQPSSGLRQQLGSAVHSAWRSEHCSSSCGIGGGGGGGGSMGSSHSQPVVCFPCSPSQSGRHCAYVVYFQ